MFMYYSTVRYFTCIFYAVVRQISMLFIDNKDSVFCTDRQTDRETERKRERGTHTETDRDREIGGRGGSKRGKGGGVRSGDLQSSFNLHKMKPLKSRYRH